MPKNKIDKQNSVTFKLVHRSQQDPLIADEDAPQRVLIPIKGKQKNLDNIFKKNEPVIEDEDINNEDIKFGEIEDELDYKIKLPSSVFPSKVEEEIGMLRKAAPVSGPQLHLDPEVVAAMDDDFDYSDPENELEDNFIELANAANNSDDDDMSGCDSEDLDEVNSLLDFDAFEKEETKSRFTEYSVTSSVIRRNEQLSLLDERFEKMFVGYDDQEIGALDCEEIEGEVSADDIIARCAGDLRQFQINDDESEKTELANKIKKQLEEDTFQEEEEFVEIDENPKEKWDCESILSTYSNIYNHPKLISESQSGKIKIDKKTGIPHAFNRSSLTSKALNKFNEGNEKLQTSSFDQRSFISIRSKNETPEERKERKKKVKEYRRERRLEKKLNTEAFKDEAKRQVKIAINNKNNIQGNKIL
ncbi:protein LTV1 homolog [Diorhabda carinulata]|uniref:protein LTV1 homolog n=1 Tax=Diorhabda carinulata TaxID=1163345 RepID=UPI0025A07898|nr:protein LTV1 homolog [Diorhabda carinulata]